MNENITKGILQKITRGRGDEYQTSASQRGPSSWKRRENEGKREIKREGEDMVW